MSIVYNSVIEADLNQIVQADLPWHEFEGTTVLITGANGFLPAYMVETLLYLNRHVLAKPVRVIGLVRNGSKAHQRFVAHVGDSNLHFIEQDVSQPLKADTEVQYIIHAASQASPKYYGTDPVGTLSANILGTINVLELARRQTDIRKVLYFSSSEVYGELDQQSKPVQENQFGYVDPTRVRSCYAESKRMGENICVSWGSQYSLPVTIVRPFHTYGPGMALDDGRVYADFVRDALTGCDIIMQSNGSAVRAFCYLADATIGFFTALLRGNQQQAYNVGNPAEAHSILELATIVAGLTPSGARKVVEFAPPIDNSYLQSPVSHLTPAINKLAELGWKPVTSVREGFARTIASYV